MVKTKQSGSAAQRRTLERQKREVPDGSRIAVHSPKGPRRGHGQTMRKKRRSNFSFVAGVVVLLIALIGIFVWLRNQPTHIDSTLQRSPTDPQIVESLTGVSQSTWESIGTGSVSNGLQSQSG